MSKPNSESTVSMELKILGQPIQLKTSGSAPFAREVLEVVSQRIQKAESRTKSKLAEHVVLLALLDLAEEHVRAKHQITDYQKKMESKAQELLTWISDLEQ
ncbi:MAG: cell division protein ZapA [Bdellovibrionales bacterium]|nr:cell division protein ZapA [Bdellovibrionales bacterium]